MMRSLFAAISGLRVHQTMLDVTANDIANVNTVGFKGSTVSFKDALSELQSGASGPSASLGGTNAEQIGLGVQLGSISSMMGAGAIQTTNNPFDLAIQGEGFFRVASIQTPGRRRPSAPSATHERATSRPTRPATWSPRTGCTSSAARAATQGPPPTFGTADSQITIPATASSVSIGQDGIVNYIDATTGTSKALAQVTLAKFPNDEGLTRAPGTNFIESPNSGTPTVGVPGDTNGLGTIAAGSLEMSNVDLAAEFTNMIEAQRGFQANGRVISTADQMLQDLVNLGRS